MPRNRVEIIVDAQDNASSVFDRIGSGLKNLISGGGLMGNAINFGMDMARRATDGFLDSIQKASAAVTDTVKSVGALASAMGVGYDQAEKLNNKIVNGLAKSAAILPGTTDDYVQVFRSVSDDVAIANKQLNQGKFNAAAYEQQVTTLASKFTALGDGMPINRTIQSLQSLLGGRSFDQIEKLTYFLKNPTLLNALKDTLGDKKLQDLTSGERLQIVLKSLNKALDDKTIAKLGDTFDAQVQTFKTNLFDPNIGFFGLLRDVDDNLEGNQTAFQGLTEALKVVVGKGGLLEAVGELFKAMGFELVDPMAALRNASLGFAATVRRIAGFFKGLASGEFGKGRMAIAQELFSAGGRIASRVGDFVRGLGVQLTQIDFAGMANSAMPVISAAIQSIDWSAWGGAIGEFLARALVAVQNFFINFDWGGLVVLIGQLSIAVIQAIAGAAGGAFGVLEGRFGEILSQIASNLSKSFGQFGSDVGVIISQAWKDLLSTVQNAFNGITQSITGLFDRLRNAISTMVSNINPFNRGGGNGLQGMGLGSQIPAAASGFVPSDGLGGLIKAAIGESGQMPGGSGLVMANSSEAILNRDQQRLLAGAITSRGGGGTFAPQINIQAAPGMDVNALAQKVMSRIQAEFQRYEAGYLV